MSKFLKFIVNIFLIAAILVAVAILVPPLMGVSTTIVDTPAMKTNLPLGSVTYSKKVDVSTLEVGDEVLKDSGAATYAYILKTVDPNSGKFNAVSAADPNGQEEEIILRNMVPKVVVEVPFIGYIVMAMQSLEGRLIIGLVVALVVILFALSELWKPSVDEDEIDEDEEEEEEPQRYSPSNGNENGIDTDVIKAAVEENHSQAAIEEDEPLFAPAAAAVQGLAEREAGEHVAEVTEEDGSADAAYAEGAYDDGSYDENGYADGYYAEGGYDDGSYDGEAYGDGYYAEGGYDDGTYAEGAYGYDDGTYSEGAYDNGAYDASYDGGAYAEGAYGNESYDEAALSDGSYYGDAYDNGAYDENSFNEVSYDNGSYADSSSAENINGDAEELSFEKAINELSYGDDQTFTETAYSEDQVLNEESYAEEQIPNKVSYEEDAFNNEEAAPAEAPAGDGLVLSDVTDEPFVTSDGRFVPVVRPGKEEILEGAAAAGINPKTVIHEPTGITFVDYSDEL